MKKNKYKDLKLDTPEENPIKKSKKEGKKTNKSPTSPKKKQKPFNKEISKIPSNNGINILKIEDTNINNSKNDEKQEKANENNKNKSPDLVVEKPKEKKEKINEKQEKENEKNKNNSQEIVEKPKEIMEKEEDEEKIKFQTKKERKNISLEKPELNPLDQPIVQNSSNQIENKSFEKKKTKDFPIPEIKPQIKETIKTEKNDKKNLFQRKQTMKIAKKKDEKEKKKPLKKLKEKKIKKENEIEIEINNLVLNFKRFLMIQFAFSILILSLLIFSFIDVHLKFIEKDDEEKLIYSNLKVLIFLAMIITTGLFSFNLLIYCNIRKNKNITLLIVTFNTIFCSNISIFIGYLHYLMSKMKELEINNYELSIWEAILAFVLVSMTSIKGKQLQLICGFCLTIFSGIKEWWNNELNTYDKDLVIRCILYLGIYLIVCVTVISNESNLFFREKNTNSNINKEIQEQKDFTIEMGIPEVPLEFEISSNMRDHDIKIDIDCPPENKQENINFNFENLFKCFPIDIAILTSDWKIIFCNEIIKKKILKCEKGEDFIFNSDFKIKILHKSKALNSIINKTDYPVISNKKTIDFSNFMKEIKNLSFIYKENKIISFIYKLKIDSKKILFELIIQFNKEIIFIIKEIPSKICDSDKSFYQHELLTTFLTEIRPCLTLLCENISRVKEKIVIPIEQLENSYFLALNTLISILNHQDFLLIQRKSKLNECNIHEFEAKIFLEEVSKPISNYLLKRGMKLISKYDANLEKMTLITDPYRLSRVLFSLMNFLMRYEKKGDIKLNITTTKTNISFELSNDLLYFKDIDEKISKNHKFLSIDLFVNKFLINEMKGSNLDIKYDKLKGVIIKFELPLKIENNKIKESENLEDIFLEVNYIEIKNRNIEFFKDDDEISKASSMQSILPLKQNVINCMYKEVMFQGFNKFKSLIIEKDCLIVNELAHILRVFGLETENISNTKNAFDILNGKKEFKIVVINCDVEGFENFYQKFSSNVKIGIVGEQTKLENIKEKGDFRCEIPIKFKKILKAISKILKMEN